MPNFEVLLALSSDKMSQSSRIEDGSVIAIRTSPLLPEIGQISRTIKFYIWKRILLPKIIPPYISIVFKQNKIVLSPFVNPMTCH